MENVTLEITAELRDEASTRMKGLVNISDRLTSALAGMQKQLENDNAAAGALVDTLTELGKINIAGGHTQGSSAGAGTESSGGGQSGTVSGAALPDMSAANAGLAALGERAGHAAESIGAGIAGVNEFAAGAAVGGNAARESAAAAMNALTGMQQLGGGALQTGAAMAGLGAVAGCASGAMQNLSGNLAGAGSAAQGAGSAFLSAAAGAASAAAGFSQTGGSAKNAASALSALGAAAGALSGRFASFHMPDYTPHAEGGILSTPHLGLVAEEGPEAVIPLSAQKRTRGIDLLRQAGQKLGVRAYAEGGVPDINTAAGSGNAGGINVGGVSVNILLENDAQPGQAIADNSAKIADEVARAIADGLEKAFYNMAIQV